jgi:hypothetical protein
MVAQSRPLDGNGVLMAWIAHPTVSHGVELDTGWHHVNCPVHADSVAEAQAGAEFMLNALAGGKLAIIRSAPSAEECKEFDTKAVTYEGHVRFSFRDEPGKWKYPDPSIETAQFLGLGGVRA